MRSKAHGVLTRAAMLAACGLLVFTGCKSLSLVSEWAAEPVAADGESGEWSLASGGTLMKDNVQVSALNNKDYLHLMVRFRTSDEKWARSAMRSGLRVWFSPDGKKRKDLGLRIATGPGPSDLPLRADRPESPGALGLDMPEDMRVRFEAMRPSMDGSIEVMDKVLESSYDLPADGSLGPGAGFTCKDGMCSYELSVPLVLNGTFGLGVEPGASVMVGITAGMSDAEREAMREQTKGMRGMGGVRGPGGSGERGGMGGRGGGGQGGQHQGMGESPELWVKVKLADE